MRKVIFECTLKSGGKLSHLLYMDKLKTVRKTDYKINGLVSRMWICGEDIGVKIGTTKEA